jgi:hypothetical protein
MEIKSEDFTFYKSYVIGEYNYNNSYNIKIMVIKYEDEKHLYECVFFDEQHGFININNTNIKYKQNYDNLYDAIDALNDFVKIYYYLID